MILASLISLILFWEKRQESTLKGTISGPGSIVFW